ncbi:peptidoglycan DD-metalloendopeptidase family protein [Rheinheimera riviphila]|uniref:peptidoglycan DD-metalloendopeptidase family protein n=1 Tax=Rheinheimera riviphila TaxID=1834037 RepID=UPI001F0C154F|nr:peptidoglycan DD-metalloendopeptidase family protein [Rheinheimera riviphila]
MLQKNGLIAGLVCSLLLQACSSSQGPAPVSYAQSRQVAKGSLQADTYQVKKGDTLFSIAFRAGMDYRNLARLNRIPEPYTIYVGQVLVTGKDNGYKTAVRGPVLTDRSANKNYSNPVKSKTPLNSSKVVAQQNQKRYGQNQQVTESEKIDKSTNNGNVSQWLWPVKGPILAKFSHQEHGNKGLDIGGAVGTPIKAAAAGQVVYAGNALRGYGNLVIIKHNDDFLSAYAHNHRLLVKERDSVSAGQLIAEMGNTDADRVQLHFEIRFRGQSVDPLKYLK